MSDVADYYVTFWEPLYIKHKNIDVPVIGYAVENYEITSVKVIYNNDEIYTSDTDMIKKLTKHPSIVLDKPKRTRKCRKTKQK